MKNLVLAAVVALVMAAMIGAQQKPEPLTEQKIFANCLVKGERLDQADAMNAYLQAQLDAVTKERDELRAAKDEKGKK